MVLASEPLLIGVIFLLHYTFLEGEAKMEKAMSLHKDYDSGSFYSDFNSDEDVDKLNHKKKVRKMLEDRLERKRLKEELEDELDGEFDWGDLDR